MWVHNSICLIIFYLVQINGKQDCRKCKPGYYAIRQCNDLHDTVCTPCPTGSYTFEANYDEQCNQCSKCDVNHFVLKQCTTTNDVVCVSCVQRKYSHLESFRTLCEGGTDKMLRDGPMSPETRTLTLEEGSGENETVLESDTKHIPKLTIIDDSPSLSENDTLTEGSGGYAIEIETSTDNEDDATSLPVTHAPIVTTTSAPVTTEKATTISPKEQKTTLSSTEHLITTKSQTTSETTPMKPTTQTTMVVPSTTTSKEGVINIDNVGIIITHSVVPEDDDGIDIHQETISTKKNEQQQYPNSDFGKTTKAPNVGNLAAQKVSKKEDGDTVTIGVLIAAVLAVAFIFFFIGFLVARCLRRRRSGSFKVMEKAGSLAVGNGVDPQADKKHEMGIYDEIGKENAPIVKRRPPSDVISPKQVDDVYAVPDKTKKKTPASPKVETKLDRIKYIDETTDEELDAKEGDKLIDGGKERTGSQASIPNGKVRHSSEMDDESTPMIKSSNDTDRSSHTKLDRSHSEDEESQPILSNEEIDQILSSDRSNETEQDAIKIGRE